jgi:SAM-dependent methyltransferase
MTQWTVETKHPVAVDSPDHLNPHGTVFRGTSSLEFIYEVERLFGSKARALCLGCSGGRLVHELNLYGHDVVGLEGSDYHVRNQSAFWPEHHNKELFTCDISQPFQVMRDSEPAQFDIITMWDVLEHIAEPCLETLFGNVHKHLSDGGLFIGTVCMKPSPHPVTGIELHQTIQPAEWWEARLSEWFDDAGIETISKETWWKMICWHGRNREQKRPSATCYDWSKWICMRRKRI